MNQAKSNWIKPNQDDVEAVQGGPMGWIESGIVLDRKIDCRAVGILEGLSLEEHTHMLVCGITVSTAWLGVGWFASSAEFRTLRNPYILPSKKQHVKNEWNVTGV